LTTKRRVLWVGDAVASSGFAMCSHAVCDHLHARGWDVHVLAINYYGDPHPYPYTIYPSFNPLEGGRDLWGVDRLPLLISQLAPDLVVILQDPWNIPGYFRSIDGAVASGLFSPGSDSDSGSTLPPIVGWLAVDGKGQKADGLDRLAKVIVWTEFARDELRQAGYGGHPAIVPLGVDTATFYPHDKAESRKVVCPSLPADSYIIGVVGRNQPRKRLDLTLAYFAEWVSACDIPNAYLFLHVGPTGDKGFDLQQLAAYHGLKGRVLVSNPHIGRGYDSALMPQIYSAFDLYWTTTQGEGWGLPALEAMACGVPCLLPDWSGLGSWAKDAACLVPCTSTAVTAPIGQLAYTIGGVPDRDRTIGALQLLYADRAARRTYGDLGRRLAEGLTWKNTAEAMERELLMVVG
jgi:D-inositol-3-phosphate glycosyltransferase